MTPEKLTAMDANRLPSAGAANQRLSVDPNLSSTSSIWVEDLCGNEGLITLIYGGEDKPSVSNEEIAASATLSESSVTRAFVIPGATAFRTGVVSTYSCQDFEEEDSIPLQDLQPTEADQQASLNKVPFPPSPAFISSSRFNETVDGRLHPKHIAAVLGANHAVFDTAAEAGIKEQTSSLFDTVKSAFRMSNHMESGLAQPGGVSLWPGDHTRWIERNTNGGPNDKLQATAGHSISGKRGRNNYPQRRSSIYHSTLGAAPSGSVRGSSLGFDDAEDFKSNDELRKISPGRYESTRPEDYLPSPEVLRAISRVQNNSESSIHDGSTIGNIYRHYVDSGIANVGSFNQSDDILPVQQSSGDGYFTQRSEGQSSSSGTPSSDGSHESPWILEKSVQPRGISRDPPNLALPKLPDHAKQVASSRIPVLTGEMSTYGQPGNHPCLPKSSMVGENPAMRRLAFQHDVQIEKGESIGSQKQSTNPFRRSQGPQVLEAAPQDRYDYQDRMYQAKMTQNRTPLEREVSEALRRASGFSAYSDGSISSSVLLDPYERRKLYRSVDNDIGLAQTYNAETTPVSGYGNGKGYLGAKSHGFYQRAAIPSGWIAGGGQNVVRVPIGQHNSPPISPRHGHKTSLKNPRHQACVEDDVGGDEWETVVDSAFGVDLNGSVGTRHFCGSINQTGSSIANYSDDGTTSSNVPDFDSFGSTERIAQHPGAINFFGDYRQRDLKTTKTPMFVPVFREHKVNGYLADSSRTKPKPAPFLSLKPQPALAKTHANPFQSSPPAIKTAGVERNLYTVGRRAQGEKRAPVPLKDFSLSTEFDHKPCALQFPRPSASTFPGKRISANLNWLNEPKESTTPRNNINSSIPVGYQTSHQAMDSKYEPANQNANEFGHGVSSASEVQGKIIFGDSPDALKDARRTSLMEAKYQKTLVQGSPGALYHGIRSRPELRDVNNTAERKVSLRSPGYNNARAEDAQQLAQAQPYGFTYRSPLAPVVSEEWKQLYTPTQLAAMEEHARQHVGNRGQPAGGFFSREDPWRVHLYEAPRLFPSPRQAERAPGAAQRKVKISIAAFCLCNLCPPLLVLFATGHLDQLMAALTSNEHSAFADRQKKWAKIATIFWLLAIIIVFVVVLVTGLEQSQID